VTLLGQIYSESATKIHTRTDSCFFILVSIANIFLTQTIAPKIN